MKRTLSTVLIVLGGLLLVPGLAALYLRVEIVDADRFEARTVAALQADPVRRAAAEQITSELVDAGATELLAVRPLVVSALDAFAGTEVFARGVGLAARDAHNVLVEGRNESFVLDLGATVAALLSQLRSVVPAAADAVPRDIDPELFALDPGDQRVQAVRAVAAWRAAGYVLPGVAVLLLIAGVWLAPRRRAGLVLAGGMVAAAGGVLAIAVALGRAAIEREAPGDFESGLPVADALTAVYDAYVADLRMWAVVALVVGAALALTGSELLDPAQRGSNARRIWGAVTRRPARPALLGVRGVAFALVGVAILIDPLGAVRVFGLAFGVLLVVLGLGEMADALGQRVQRAEPRLGRAPTVALAIGALLAVGSTTVAAAVVTSRQAKPPGPPEAPAEGCNGAEELCALRLDQVAFPGTHNSFSAAEEPGWLFANQRFGIERQLRDGIRLLLIDVHIGVRDGDRVRTDLQAEGVSRNKVAKALGEDALAAAERVAGGIGAGNLAGPRELFLCHTLCELGAEPLDEELAVIRRFLEAEPGAVLVLFVEPYVTPDQLEAAFERAGLLDHLAEIHRDEPLPTLGELVDSDRRIVVFTEAGGGARPWYLAGFSFAQDTPLGATDPSEFSCTRNRGDANSPLLLINHWVDTFPPSPRGNARIGGGFLRQRLEQCAARRRLWPSLVAVDYYDTSGVVEDAAEWNRRAVAP